MEFDQKKNFIKSGLFPKMETLVKNENETDELENFQSSHLQSPESPQTLEKVI